MLEAQSNIKKINEARLANGKEEKVSEDDDPQLMGEAKTAINDMFDMNVNSIELSLEDRVAMLNADQRRIFDAVKSHLLQQQHEANECQCDFKPLRMFVSGVGGTGKSFLIEAIKALVGSIWPSDSLTCAVAAPTDLAAFNVGGITIHRLFQLPIEHWSLPRSSQKVMKTTLRNVKMIIVDKVSMVSSLNLAYMHLRLEDPSVEILSLTTLPQNSCYSNWGAQRPLTFGETLLCMTSSPLTNVREKTKSSHLC